MIALGVQADGTVQFASDSNYQGEPFYSTPESWQNITSAAVGRYLAVGLKADGSVVVAGEQEDILRRQTDQWHGISFIAAGENSIVGISERGELFAAGTLSRYLDDFTGSGPFTSAFGVSDRCALLLKEDGHVFPAWNPFRAVQALSGMEGSDLRFPSAHRISSGSKRTEPPSPPETLPKAK